MMVSGFFTSPKDHLRICSGEAMPMLDAGMGAEAVKKLLADLNLEELSASLRAQMKDASPAPATVVDEGVHRLLEHPLLVAHDDVGGVELGRAQGDGH